MLDADSRQHRLALLQHRAEMTLHRRRQAI